MSTIGPSRRSLIRGAWRIAAAASIAACGSAGPPPYGNGNEPPYGEIGFVGTGGEHHFFDGGKGGGVVDAGGGSDGSHAALDGSGMGSMDASGSGGLDATGGTPVDGGSSVGVIINLPPGFFAYLNWTISGPAGSYSGTVHFGNARSLEFVVGGVAAGDGYTITLSGPDPNGDPCTGTSAPFMVSPGATTGAGVIIECFTGDGGAVAATVMTGNVAVDAGVTVPGH